MATILRTISSTLSENVLRKTATNVSNDYKCRDVFQFFNFHTYFNKCMTDKIVYNLIQKLCNGVIYMTLNIKIIYRPWV